MEYLKFSFLTAIIRNEWHQELSSFLWYKISSSILISKSVSSNNDGLSPARNKSWNVFDDNWFTENSTTKDVSNCTVRWLPHLFKFKLLYSCLISSDCCAFYTNTTLLYSSRSINRYLIVCSISVLNAQVVISNVKVKEGEDQLKIKLRIVMPFNLPFSWWDPK